RPPRPVRAVGDRLQEEPARAHQQEARKSPSGKGDNAMKFKLLSFVSAVTLLVASPLPAQDTGDSPTLKRIAERGMVSIGHRETSIPFSYMDQGGKPIGYSIDICMKIVEAVRAQLGKPDLGVKMVPVTGQTRIPLLANGTIDIECGS